MIQVSAEALICADGPLTDRMLFVQLRGGRDGLLRDGAGRSSQEIPGAHPSSRGSAEGRTPHRGFQVRTLNTPW